MPKIRVLSVLVVTAGLLPVAAHAQARTPSRIPERLVGTWAAQGACTVPARRLVVTAHRMALGTAPPADAVFSPNDDGAGHAALRWAGEGNVDNFSLRRPGGPLIYNPEGYGMPGQVAYTRCPG